MTQRLVIEIEYPDGHNVAGVLADVSEIVHRELTKPQAACEGNFSSNLRWGNRDYGQVWVALGPAQKFQHLGRGTQYSRIGGAIVQTETPLSDNDAVVVYQDRDTRALFARRPSEFYDRRRFTPLNP